MDGARPAGQQGKPPLNDSAAWAGGASPPVASERRSKDAAQGDAALLQRVKVLEDRIASVREVESKLDHLERELMLARSSVSGLSALQEIVNVRKHAEGCSLRACLRLMIKKKMETRPEMITTKRKRRAASILIDHITTRQAVDQLLAMASLEAVGVRGVGGRVSGRFVRFGGRQEALQMAGFSAEEAFSVMYKKFTRLNGTVSTRLLLERHVDDSGSVWFILGRNSDQSSVDVAQRSVGLQGGSQAHTRERLNRSTVLAESIQGLPKEVPLFLRWSALGDPVRPAGASDADAVGRLTLSLPVCVIEDDALDLQSLL